MRGQREGGLSATTKVKVYSPEMVNIAHDQGFHVLEASTAARVKGGCDGGVLGYESVAGNPTVHIRTGPEVTEVTVYEFGTFAKRGVPEGMLL